MPQTHAKKRIIAVGLNPAWQRTLRFDAFKPGAVNRAKSATPSAAGKGVNFARAAKIWGKCDAVIVQFAGGDTGQKLVEGIEAEGLLHCTERVEAPTRACTTLLSSAPPAMTELIEPSEPVPAEAASRLLSSALDMLPSASALALCGTFPPGVEPEFYASLAKAAKAAGKPVLLDSYMGIREVLKAGVDILKINLEELESLCGRKPQPETLQELRASLGVKTLAVTDGPREAYLASDEGAWAYSLPALEKVVSPLGAGDSCAAVFLSELLCGAQPGEAFAAGLSAASASCLTGRCASFEKDAALSLLRKTHAKSLSAV